MVSVIAGFAVSCIFANSVAPTTFEFFNYVGRCFGAENILEMGKNIHYLEIICSDNRSFR